MKLHSVVAIAIDIPLPLNFGGSTYNVLKRSTVITRLRTQDGLTSNVYNGDNRAHAGEIARLIREVLLPLVKGMIKVLNLPGFGIELDEKMVKQYRVG